MAKPFALDFSPAKTPRMRGGLTLIELLVVVATVGLVVAILLSAVQQSREASRRGRCISRLHELGIGIDAYQGAKGTFPLGNYGRGFSLHVSLLPYMEQTPLYGQIDFSVLSTDAANAAVRKTSVPAFLCPSDPVAGALKVGQTNYAGNFGTGVAWFGYNGVFVPWREPFSGEVQSVRAASIRDGLTQTAAIGEILVADSTKDLRRAAFYTPAVLAPPTSIEVFASLCDNLSPSAAANPWTRGSPWVHGDISVTGYVHILPPNRKSCSDGGSVQEGAYTAASLHPGGVNLLLADGHVEFVADAVDLPVWRARGSRAGGEAFNN